MGSSSHGPHAFDLGLAPFALEEGPPLPRVSLAGWCWGPVSDRTALEARARLVPVEATAPRSPAPLFPPDPSAPRLSSAVPTVLIIHALTGDAVVGGDGGWWAPLVGPGRPLDPSRARLLCFNNLGSCYGSFGPSAEDWPQVSEDPATGRAMTLPAPVSTWDQARALLRALDGLGLEHVELAIGGSLGGMLVLALGALAPERFGHLVPIAASAAGSPWVIGFNHVARQILLLDPDWPRARRGLELARQLAQMTYRAEPGLELRQGRLVRPPHRDDPRTFVPDWHPSRPYAQETYLEHHGRKLVERYDARSYLVQLAAMCHHDVSRRPPEPSAQDSYTLGEGPWTGLARYSGPIDAVGIDTDQLYPPHHMRDVAETAARGSYHELSSVHGHDGFLIEWDQMKAILRATGSPVLSETQPADRARTAPKPR